MTAPSAVVPSFTAAPLRRPLPEMTTGVSWSLGAKAGRMAVTVGVETPTAVAVADWARAGPAKASGSRQAEARRTVSRSS